MISTRTRYALKASFLIAFVGFVLLVNHIVDLLGQYRIFDYVLGLAGRRPVTDPLSVAVANQRPAATDQIVVVAKLEREDTEWMKELLTDWRHAIYLVDPLDSTPKGVLTTPANKGHEAMAYLTYLIDHYDSLPSTIAFIHPHRNGFLKAWHTDAPMHDNVYAMRHLQTAFVQQNGYVNLRCKYNPGCIRVHRQSQNMKHITPEIWTAVFANTSTPPPGVASAAPERGERPPRSFPMPAAVGAACCAQFAVSRTQVRERPWEDYVAFRNWLTATELSDAKSGRVFEYLWHIIFGADAV
ncbi:hypothetical protein MBLNU459_g1256t1 [Dothideomycetes sp. NU459]